MPVSEYSTTEFLNIDLDLHVESGIEELLRCFGSSVIILNRTPQTASLELNSSKNASLEETTVGLAELVKSLTPQAKAIWERCDLRCFNVGIQAGKEPYAESFTISSKTLSLLASIQAELTFTVYAPPDLVGRISS